MTRYKRFVREFLSEYTDTLRKLRGLTQAEMAEQLRITSRAYGDLEQGKYCFSAIALLFLLLMLSNEERKRFLENFHKRICELERHNVGV